MFNSFVIDLISRQHNGDVNLYAFLNEDVHGYEWIRMLPHFRQGNISRNIICDNQSKNNVFESLYKELTLRSEVQGIRGYNVILIMNEHGIKNHPISRFVEYAAKLNTVFVFFERREEYLPLYCSKVIKVEKKYAGELFGTENKDENVHPAESCAGESEET